MDNLNACPYPGCKRRKIRSMYACRQHWFSLPRDIRDEIHVGYRTSASNWLEADGKAMAWWKKRLEIEREEAKNALED